jgi:NAD(P)-dependent dehydrogenase (short-subunit alcohol dehydrogenase family)
MGSVDLSLEGKVALVTGGSKGIGRAIALAFAEHGADVAIAARGVEALDATREALLATGRRAIAVQCDVGNDDDLARTVRETEEQLGGVGILVNNAATGSQASLRRTTADELLQVMRVNVWAPLRLSQLCHPGMVERGGGVIINVVSNEGVRPSIGIGVYAPSKAALINLSQLCAKHWARDGIRVTSIAPGLIRTELAAGLVEAVESSGQYPNPQRRIGEPEEIAGLALLLASPAGTFATGANFIFDGGEVISGAGEVPPA